MQKALFLAKFLLARRFMKDEVSQWIKYAEENFESSKVLLDEGLFNPCLQNVQQSVEKALKAVVVENMLSFHKTHDIFKVKSLLFDNSIVVDISDDDCDFLNSIYLPSKYPLGSVIADYEPDIEICDKAIDIALRVIDSVKHLLGA